MDLAVFVAIVLSFAAFVTTHVALVYGLLVRAPRWRGPVGLVVAPLAPYWGFKAGLRGRSFIWLGAFAAYAAALIANHWLGGR